jgi:hypothetical protein
MGNNDPVAHSYKLPGIWAFVKAHVGIVRLAHNDTISSLYIKMVVVHRKNNQAGASSADRIPEFDVRLLPLTITSAGYFTERPG